ncbi:DNA repair protein-like protein rad5 [Aaosphaeria arxii CBS 175.79]|uniref:DNA repair protein-like protein rad5 n=1 Tax=Aaosphaeria arxii CBS 175.79 TaxID=1450172 RepID=A0A6A5X600_9PLEO|nr:DNA repair protein-like protein rad5 [Aaosphaeria arxii CBS 175.79]KAF2008369.1 DNA repair protein-like protein rad5 [Aaosphaeria arxii CBS 175.79]
MDDPHPGERPRKKPRFWVEKNEEPVVESVHPAVTPLHVNVSPSPSPPPPNNEAPTDEQPKVEDSELHADSITDGFDTGLLQAVVGELAPSVLQILQRRSNNDVQRAINLYLDGSWQSAPPSVTPSTSTSLPFQTRLTNGLKRQDTEMSSISTPDSEASSTPMAPILKAMPSKRYIGSFGAVAWATRSGRGLLQHAEKVGIERSKMKEYPTKKRAVNNKKQDVVVRFTNAKGEEVGRLENGFAAWISVLIDQKLCSFEGSCVYVPDRLKTGETVYLQLQCFFVRSAFDKRKFVKPDSNRAISPFEELESRDEKDLRLRQVAMVKLFEAINLSPSRNNESTEKHKRQGLLQAAESAESKEQKEKTKAITSTLPGSSPPSEENEEGEELEQDQLDSLYKKAQSFDFNTPTLEPASTFSMDLRKYQKQALHWMVGKERDEAAENRELSMHPLWEEYVWPTQDADNNPVPTVDEQTMFYVNPYSGELSLEFPRQEQNCLGGILADEMGLGKTIEMLSLIHTHRNSVQEKDSTVKRLPRLSKSSATVEQAPYTTLVVAPMSLLAQWASEAEKASKDGTLKILLYYGAEKSANLQKLCCEANGANAPNVVITSYGTILSEFNQVAAMDGNRGSHGGLFSLEYFRIILDEAHYIKNRQSKTAKACYELSATHRWVLTGTPIVNRLEDLFSLVRFLKVEPWSNFSFWRTFITVPFESKDFLRALDVVQTVLEPLVLRRTKDMKTPSGEALVPLPPRTIEIDKIQLSQDEREVYDYIYMRAKRVFAQNAEAGTLMKSYTTIFAQILRLRQSCCHPVLTRKKDIVAEEEDAAEASDLANGLADDMDLQSLIERFQSDGEQDANSFGAHVLKQIQDESNSECPICSEEPMLDQAVTGCWHSACKECLLNYINHQRDRNILPLCFNCRNPINARDIFEVVRHDHLLEEDSLQNSIESSSQTPRISLRRIGLAGSAKTQALLGHLKAERREDRATKSVVFSQFTSFLDLIEPALTRDHIPFVRFDGSMSQKQRAIVLQEFNESSQPYVLLLSLRAGGVGLNLTCAQRVFMMDPWWSFAVEAQAIDRVHRMGQTKKVKVVRFVVEGSIEEKMLKIQDRKKFIASSLGMMSDEEKKLQRIEDIKELLS